MEIRLNVSLELVFLFIEVFIIAETQANGSEFTFPCFSDVCTYPQQFCNQDKFEQRCNYCSKIICDGPRENIPLACNHKCFYRPPHEKESSDCTVPLVCIVAVFAVTIIGTIGLLIYCIKKKNKEIFVLETKLGEQKLLIEEEPQDTQHGPRGVQPIDDTDGKFKLAV